MLARTPISILQLEPVRQALRPHVELLFPLFFIGFFIAALIGIAFNTNSKVRNTYVVGLFLIIIFFNVTGGTLLPITHWQKFTQYTEQDQTVHEIRVVDANGNELHYDHRATLGVDGVTIFIMQQELMEDRPREEKVRRARFLLQRANVYRERVESRPVTSYVRFPPHGLDNIWTPKRLDGYAEFVGIRVYRIDIDTGADGQRLTSASETLVMEYLNEEGTERSAGVANSSGKLSTADSM